MLQYFYFSNDLAWIIKPFSSRRSSAICWRERAARVAPDDGDRETFGRCRARRPLRSPPVLEDAVVQQVRTEHDDVRVARFYTVSEHEKGSDMLMPYAVLSP
jgi:hypothetical protein